MRPAQSGKDPLNLLHDCLFVCFLLKWPSQQFISHDEPMFPGYTNSTTKHGDKILAYGQGNDRI